MAKVDSVEEYLDGFDGGIRAHLDAVRALMNETAPTATEAIRWGSPAWLHPSGTILFILNGHAKHIGIAFTPSTREAFAGELDGYDLGKGTVKIRATQEVPLDVLRRMIEYRVREHEDDGVLWM